MIRGNAGLSILQYKIRRAQLCSLVQFQIRADIRLLKRSRPKTVKSTTSLLREHGEQESQKLMPGKQTEPLCGNNVITE